jgi:hypothetical protein
MSMGYACAILQHLMQSAIHLKRKGECEFSLTGLSGWGSIPQSALCLGGLIFFFGLSALRYFYRKPMNERLDRKAMKKTVKSNVNVNPSQIESICSTFWAVAASALSGLALSG